MNHPAVTLCPNLFRLVFRGHPSFRHRRSLLGVPPTRTDVSNGHSESLALAAPPDFEQALECESLFHAGTNVQTAKAGRARGKGWDLPNLGTVKEGRKDVFTLRLCARFTRKI